MSLQVEGKLALEVLIVQKDGDAKGVELLAMHELNVGTNAESYAHLT